MGKKEILKRYILFIISLFFSALGVAFTKSGELGVSPISSVIMNSGEAFVKAVSDSLKKNFGNVKIAFDVFCVAFSIVLSLIFFNFSVVGTREGTIISAFLTGTFVKLFTKILHKPVSKMLVEKNN